MNESDITKRPERWSAIIGTSADALPIGVEFLLNSLPRVAVSAFQCPQNIDHAHRSTAYVALLDTDAENDAWCMTDSEGRVLAAFRFPKSLVLDRSIQADKFSYDDGFDDGYKAGYKDGRAKVEILVPVLLDNDIVVVEGIGTMLRKYAAEFATSEGIDESLREAYVKASTGPAFQTCKGV